MKEEKERKQRMGYKFETEIKFLLNKIKKQIQADNRKISITTLTAWQKILKQKLKEF